MSIRNIRIQCTNLTSFPNCFRPDVLTPRHGGRIPDWDEADDIPYSSSMPPSPSMPTRLEEAEDLTPLPTPPQVERITTRLEDQYESLMEPVNDKFHKLMEERWAKRQRDIASEWHDNEIRKILVDMLGGPKKDDLFDKLIGKISTANTEDDLKVCAYKYKRMTVKRIGEIPTSVWDSTHVEGTALGRQSIHWIFQQTNILDRVLDAFGKNFTRQMQSHLVEETDNYILYEESLIIGYHPNMEKFYDKFYKVVEHAKHE